MNHEGIGRAAEDQGRTFTVRSGLTRCDLDYRVTDDSALAMLSTSAAS